MCCASNRSVQSLWNASYPYTCWPVFVIPLKLPPGVLLQRQNVFLSLIIPEHLGNNMGVFMEPMFDELVRAWGRGMDIQLSYKDKLQNACLIPLLPA
jgi:hypothetical protein